VRETSFLDRVGFLMWFIRFDVVGVVEPSVRAHSQVCAHLLGATFFKNELSNTSNKRFASSVCLSQTVMMIIISQFNSLLCDVFRVNNSKAIYQRTMRTLLTILQTNRNHRHEVCYGKNRVEKLLTEHRKAK
jgi:hypothetical protein